MRGPWHTHLQHTRVRDHRHYYAKWWRAVESGGGAAGDDASGDGGVHAAVAAVGGSGAGERGASGPVKKGAVLPFAGKT